MASALNLSSIIDYHNMLYKQLKLICQIFPDCDMAKYPLEVNMFKKPNSKMMHSVFYSLIYLVSSVKCRTLLPWPIVFKADTYKFKTGIFKFIEEEFTDFNSPKIAHSLINSASGDRFVQFMCRFCMHATRLIVQNKYGYDLLNRIKHLTPENKRLFHELTRYFEIIEENKQEQFDKNFSTFENNIRSMLEERSNAEKQVETQTKLLAEMVDNIDESCSCNKAELMDVKNNAMHDWFKNIRSLQAKLTEEQTVFIQHMNLVNRLKNLLHIRDDLLKVRLNGFEMVIDIPDYVLNLVEMRPEEDTRKLLYVDDKLSLEKLLAFGHAVVKKHIQNYTQLEPSGKYCDIIQILKNKLESSREDMKRFDELDNEMKDIIHTKNESITNLRNTSINNLTEHDVNLYSIVRSSGRDISFPLNNNYAQPLPDIFARFNAERNKRVLKIVEAGHCGTKSMENNSHSKKNAEAGHRGAKSVENKSHPKFTRVPCKKLHSEK